ncbi:MAG: Ig-like domain-containing protein, partial [Prolixibacteraceae bacterium]|nr:Ig-like domain-containing protein [Prolixibacteraceae bacterium]
MRKSFTWLSSLIVLMLLSFQMALAAPQLATNGLSPSDGGKIDPNNAEFTLTFKGDVMPTEGQIIGLYSSSTTQPENKAIQLRAVDKSTDGSVITYTHPDGTVTFNGKVVTIVFNDVDWSTVPTYWVTIGSSAIKDATGNFDVATAFDGGDLTDKWDFTVKDLVPPTWSQLDPKDNAIEVAVDKTFSIKFNEDVKFVGATPYVQQLEDFAIYTSTDWDNVVNEQEGGDLVSTYAPNLLFYNDGGLVNPTTTAGVAFDSISINWVADLPGNTDLYVRIKKDMLQDLEGNKFAGMNDEDLWNITTK